MKSSCIAIIFFLASFQAFCQLWPYNITAYDTSSKGYYFMSTFVGGIVTGTNYNLILDSKGQAVYYQLFPKGGTGLDFKIQPNGLMSYFLKNKFYLMDSTFKIVDSVSAKNGYAIDDHELQILPNGHYLFLTDETDTMDLSGYNYFKGGAQGSKNARVTCGVIQELDANKNLVFEWHAKDHFAFDGVDSFWLSDSAKVDWTHFNALELDKDGNILVSSRHFNEITKINHTDGSVIWRLGGKYNQFTFINDTARFYGQHDIRRIGNGNITFYDDGNYIKPHGARGVEYALDEVNKTATLKWSYTYDKTLYSLATGSVQRLPNGNTLIDYGALNKNSVCFAVVDSTGKRVFGLTYQDRIFSYRAFNYFSLPWALKRPQVSCFDSNGVHYLDAGPGYSSYRWSNGHNTRTVQVAVPGTYSVFVPYGKGFISSEKVVITDTSRPEITCLPTSVYERLNNTAIHIYPNPVTDRLNISLNPGFKLESDIAVYDISGRKMNVTQDALHFDSDSMISYNISALLPGVYFIRLNASTVRFVKQ